MLVITMATVQLNCQGHMYEDLDISRVEPVTEGALCQRCGWLNAPELKSAVQVCFACGYCNANFFTKLEFYEHLCLKHSIRECIPCENKVGPTHKKATSLSYQRHAAWGHLSIFKKCIKCKFCFIDESNFVFHMKRCHVSGHLIKSLSNKSPVVDCWVEHRVFIVKLNVCPPCWKLIAQKGLRHCELCFATVSPSEQLLSHINLKHVHCSQCDTWFAHKTGLTHHRQSCCASKNVSTNGATLQPLDHAVEFKCMSNDGYCKSVIDRNLCKCTICYPFSWFANQVALNIHNRENHQVCSKCDAAFDDRVSLLRHCKECNNEFSASNDIRGKGYQNGVETVRNEITAINEDVEKKLTAVFEQMFDWPLQMKLGMGRRTPKEIIASILQSFDPSSAVKCNEEKNVAGNMEGMLADLFCNVTSMIDKGEFSWVFSCDPLELLSDVHTVMLKYLTRDELSTHSFNCGDARQCGYFTKYFGRVKKLQSLVEYEYYCCPFCKMGFDNFDAFSSHEGEDHHGIWPLICYLCGEKHGKVLEIRRHMYIVHNIDYVQFLSYCSTVSISLPKK